MAEEKSPPDGTPATAPAISAEWLARMQKRPEFLRALFENFLAEEPKRLAALAAAVEADDREQVRYLAHSLKGAAATLGMEPLRDACRELEFAARDGAAPAPLLADVQARLEEVFAAVRALGQ